MNRVDRLVAMIVMLQAKKRVTGREIARHFSISLRTVYRDMGALSEAGVPVAAEAGEGYSLVEGYHLPPVMFTAEEASALFMGAQFVDKMTDDSLKKHAREALLKIRSVLPEETRSFIEQLSNRTALFNRFEQDDAPAHLAEIQRAVVAHHVLDMDYYTPSTDKMTQRYVEPLGLVFYADHWHLIAWCRLRKDYRDFRSDRIKRLRTTDHTFRKRPDFSIVEYLKEFERMEDAREVRLWVTRHAAPVIRDKYSYGLMEEQEAVNGVEMLFIVSDLKWMMPWLLAFRDAVVVQEPAELRDMLAAEAMKTYMHHTRPARKSPS